MYNLVEVSKDRVYKELGSGVPITAIYPSSMSTIGKCKFTPNNSQAYMIPPRHSGVLCTYSDFLSKLMTEDNVRYYKVVSLEDIEGPRPTMEDYREQKESPCTYCESTSMEYCLMRHCEHFIRRGK